MMSITKKKNSDLFVYIAFGFLVAFITYTYVISELSNGYSDYSGHAYIYLPYFFSGSTLAEGFKAVPYCMWHLITLFFYKVLNIALDPSAAYTSCIFAVFSYGVGCFMIDKISERYGAGYSAVRTAFLSTAFYIAQPLYFYWIGRGERFTGVYSPNPFHNPTLMCARGFSLLAFCLIVDIWGAQSSSEYKGLFFRTEKGLKKYYIYLAIVLFLSAMAKPTFAECFIPAVGIIMLVRLFMAIFKRKGKEYSKHFLDSFLCAVPTLLYIFLQFGAYFLLGGSYGSDDSRIIITRFGEVWSMYSDNIPLSMLLGMAFPIYMVLVDTRFFLKEDQGKLALTVYGIGFLQAMLLGESGGKLAHADFIWPMMSGMLLMYAVSLLRLISMEAGLNKVSDPLSELGSVSGQKSDLRKKIIVAGGWILFLSHVLCGVLFLK